LNSVSISFPAENLVAFSRLYKKTNSPPAFECEVNEDSQEKSSGLKAQQPVHISRPRQPLPNMRIALLHNPKAGNGTFRISKFVRQIEKAGHLPRKPHP
jgi:hypothetical protein